MKPLNEITVPDIVESLKKIDKKTWIKIAVASVGVAFVLFVFILPAWVSRFKVKAELKNLKEQVKTFESLQKQKPKLIKRKTETLDYIEGAKSRLFQIGEASLLLGQISKLATESNVAIVASSPKPFESVFPKPFDNLYEASQYDFTVEGAYHDIGTFIAKIESNPKQLRIQSFYLRANTDEAIVGKHIADLSLTAVSHKKPAEESEKKSDKKADKKGKAKTSKTTSKKNAAK